MRLLSPILMLLLAGCSVWDHGDACQQPAACGQCQDGASCNAASCQECGTCENSHCNWFCSHGWCVHGRHPRYKRFEDNILTTMEARHIAQSDLRRLDNDQCLTCDYRLGYEQAYVDVSLGSCGQVPALPPANYWTTCARTPEGHQKAQQWFSGYAAGAARAKAVYEPFNEVAASQFGSDGCNGWNGNRWNE